MTLSPLPRFYRYSVPPEASLIALRALIAARIDLSLSALFDGCTPSVQLVESTVEAEIMRVDFVLGASPFFGLSEMTPGQALRAVAGMDC